MHHMFSQHVGRLVQVLVSGEFGLIHILNFIKIIESPIITSVIFLFNNWKVVKPLLQERTRRKIQVLQGSGKEELLKVNINIIFKCLLDDCIIIVC